MSSEMRELAEEGLAYFERIGDAGDKKYVEAIRALLARTEAGADGWPDIKPDGFDAREIAACNDIEQLRNWAGCMRRERDNWRHRAQDAELALSDARPQDASGDAAKLSDVERKAVADLMESQVYEAGDVDDEPPSIDEDEDAYWAYHNYHGLRKLLAAMQAKEAK